MKANELYLNKNLDFWANIKLINQKLGYINRKKNGCEEGCLIPDIKSIKKIFQENHLDYSSLIKDNTWTEFGQDIINYLKYRNEALNYIKDNLMSKDIAKTLFYDLLKAEIPKCKLPFNKQKGDKYDYAFLTGIVNILIEKTLKEEGINHTLCNYDPRELTSVTINNKPVRVLSRRVDGAFPSTINPIAIWEIKEYYYTTTFGSRVADGVYETQLDGWELREVKENLGIPIQHYLITDDYNTWWNMGKSYLCRFIDCLHMGLLTEPLFGKEVVTRIPELVREWIVIFKQRDNAAPYLQNPLPQNLKFDF